MIPEYRIATLVTGILLAAAAPFIVARLPRWEGWTLGLLAWSWGWGRILICFAWPPADLATRLMVYAFIAAVTSGFCAAAAIFLRGRSRAVAVLVLAALGGALLFWYAVDHDAFLSGPVAGLNLSFPALLAALALTGLAATLRADDAEGRSLSWLGAGLLALPAYRGVEISMALSLSTDWPGPVARAEALLYVATMVMLISGMVHASRNARRTAAWAVIAAAIALGGLTVGLSRSVDGSLDRHIRYGLDGAMALLALLGLLLRAWPGLVPAHPPPVPAQGP